MRPTETAGAWRSAAERRNPTVPESRRQGSRPYEARTRWARGLIACAVFLAMLCGGLMIGTKPFHTEQPRQARTAGTATTSGDRAMQGDGPTAGWIIQEQPGGINCQYMQFDNITERVGERHTGACEDAPRKQAERRPGQFSWGR
jgi:hypothetical protein